MENSQKIVQYKDINTINRQLVGEKVLVGGCFDVLHIGHVRFLESAKKQGDVLIVALESDEFIQKKKNRHPFHTQLERAEILAAIIVVDYIVLLPYLATSSEYQILVTHVMPDIIAVTENDSQRANKELQARSANAKVVTVIPYIPQKTSSDLLKAMQKEL